jgi:hypothetical protein
MKSSSGPSSSPAITPASVENAKKFVAVVAALALALLAGCAVTVPLREIAPSGHILPGIPEGDLACTADNKCSDSSGDEGAIHR